jgi:hypothetical protein
MGPESFGELGRVYWEDRDCGYREVTTPEEVYDYKREQFVNLEIRILRFHKPRPPLPEREQPDYLRQSIVAQEVPQGQQKLEAVV